ncbi:cytochrome b-245 chaperone 1 isoform X1 [Cebus imitator]|uniref:cytochrome b-245 chaperone 1 isoform X1 n=1 Tax=Cebus imitator TaxID=2715852 RepID=UPI00080A4C0F|nr:cytochrome b-245 chaperone 1 isoform X1 [Cebus imitator]
MIGLSVPFLGGGQHRGEWVLTRARSWKAAGGCQALETGGFQIGQGQTPPPVESGAAVPGMYMQVETRTSARLHLKRAPGIRSWSLLVGILSIGLAAAYYSGDTLGWKLFYVTGCLFVAVQNLEDWEEAVFDKSTGKVVLKTFSLYKKLLTLFRAGHDQVVVLLQDVRDVSVEEEKVRYFGKGYVVVLRLATGFSHPLTQSAVMGHRSDVEAVAKLITSFLELHCLESPTEMSQSSDSEAGDPGSQS